jgi:ADP-ribose pyrophosphatase YjhB (NUDIX family)
MMMDPLLRRLKPFIRRTIGFLARIIRPMTLGVRVLVRDGEGRVFLVRHSYLPGWYLPGGGVDAGETIAAAALRELREEGGLIGEAPTLFSIYHNIRTSKRDHVALYCIDRFAPASPPWRPNAEIREIGFFALDALPPDTSEATRRRIREVIDGVPPAESW